MKLQFIRYETLFIPQTSLPHRGPLLFVYHLPIYSPFKEWKLMVYLIQAVKWSNQEHHHLAWIVMGEGGILLIGILWRSESYIVDNTISIYSFICEVGLITQWVRSCTYSMVSYTITLRDDREARDRMMSWKGGRLSNLHVWVRRTRGTYECL